MKHNINFTEYNQGDKGLIFIPNAGGHQGFMRKQVEYFANLEHHVLAVDLPGRGEGSAFLEELYTVEVLAKEILTLAQERGFKQATIIGLNYGASIAIEIAANNSDFVTSVILLDPAILMAPWVTHWINVYIKDLLDSEVEMKGKDIIKTSAYLLNEEDRNMAEEAYNNMPRNILASLYSNLLKWDKNSNQKLLNCKMPILYLQSQNILYSENEFKKLCPHATIGLVVGSGHWMTLEVPEQVNTMIKRFLEITRLVEKLKLEEA